MAEKYQELQDTQRLFQDDKLTYEGMVTKITKQMREWAILPTPPPGSPLPVWRGMTLGEVRTTIRGQIKTSITKGKLVLTPKASSKRAIDESFAKHKLYQRHQRSSAPNALSTDTKPKL
ncbi:MAG: hypothetical protein Q9169_008675 [Polycauliona sp. 2 TL-2023]